MYGDPGLLSLIIAAVAGAIFAIPLYVRSVRIKIKGWFDGKRNKTK